MKRKMFRLKLLIFNICLCGFLFSPILSFAQDININLIAINGSDKVKTMEFKSYLPHELNPDDILDVGKLKLDYDVDKGAYFVHDDIEFQPKESRTFKVRVKDVWKINPTEIKILRKQLDKNLKDLSNHESYQEAKITAARISDRLESIVSKQEKLSANIDRRIEEYRAAVVELGEIRDQIYNLDYLKFEAKAMNEIVDAQKTIKMVIEAKNPSKKVKSIEYRHYLPTEIRAHDVVDSKGFDVRFDAQKSLSYLTVKEEFQPLETKKYEILIRDIWQFPMLKLVDLEDRARIAEGELAGTFYEESAHFLLDKILNEIQAIRVSQVPQPSIKEHIGLYRKTNERFELIWEDFKRIEEMIAIVRAKKLEELESKKVKNVLQRLKALRGLSALSEMLFKKTISITVTWKIIMGAIIFVAFFTTLHFFIWAKRSKTMGEELAPADGEGVKEVPKPGEEKKDDDE